MRDAEEMSAERVGLVIDEYAKGSGNNEECRKVEDALSEEEDAVNDWLENKVKLRDNNVSVGLNSEEETKE